jgi:hypothetical protein
MNYIKQLQKTVEEQKAEIAELRQGYQDLRVYLNLPKFSVDTYVNRNDVLLRIEESLSRANSIDALTPEEEVHQSYRIAHEYSGGDPIREY